LTGLLDLIRERADAAPDALALLAPALTPERLARVLGALKAPLGPVGPLAGDGAVIA